MAFFFLVCCASALYVFSAYESFRAARREDSAGRADLEAAVRLQPSNAQYHHRLGIFYLFADQDARKAVPQLRQATDLAPHVARFWLSLATAYGITGEADLQRQALVAAAADEPINPEVNWMVANFFLVRGEVEASFPYFRNAFAGDPRLVNRGTRLLWRVATPVATILPLLPRTANASFAFLDALVDQNEPEAAGNVWQSLMSSGYRFTPQAALPYIQYLIGKGRADDATRAWRQMVARQPQLAPASDDHNLIFNGDFEVGILNGGFDWRYREVPGVRVEVAESDAGNALQVTFDGQAVGECGISHVIAVHPDTNYVLSASVKTESLIGAGAPHFQLRDYLDNAEVLNGEDLRGTFAWQERVSRFRTGPATRLLELRVVRPNSSGIKGTIWIDHVSLRPEGAQ